MCEGGELYEGSRSISFFVKSAALSSPKVERLTRIGNQLDAHMPMATLKAPTSTLSSSVIEPSLKGKYQFQETIAP